MPSWFASVAQKPRPRQCEQARISGPSAHRRPVVSGRSYARTTALRPVHTRGLTGGQARENSADGELVLEAGSARRQAGRQPGGKTAPCSIGPHGRLSPTDRRGPGSVRGRRASAGPLHRRRPTPAPTRGAAGAALIEREETPHRTPRHRTPHVRSPNARFLTTPRSPAQTILSCSSPKSAMSLRVPPRAET